MKTQYPRWKVALGFLVFMVMMSFAGKSDQDSAQVVLEEKTEIRDRLKLAVERQETELTAYFVNRARGGK